MDYQVANLPAGPYGRVALIAMAAYRASLDTWIRGWSLHVHAGLAVRPFFDLQEGTTDTRDLTAVGPTARLETRMEITPKLASIVHLQTFHPMHVSGGGVNGTGVAYGAALDWGWKPRLHLGAGLQQESIRLLGNQSQIEFSNTHIGLGLSYQLGVDAQ